VERAENARPWNGPPTPKIIPAPFWGKPGAKEVNVKLQWRKINPTYWKAYVPIPPAQLGRFPGLRFVAVAHVRQRQAPGKPPYFAWHLQVGSFVMGDAWGQQFDKTSGRARTREAAQRAAEKNIVTPEERQAREWQKLAETFRKIANARPRSTKSATATTRNPGT
jgi:hypothetical protein